MGFQVDEANMCRSASILSEGNEAAEKAEKANSSTSIQQSSQWKHRPMGQRQSLMQVANFRHGARHLQAQSPKPAPKTPFAGGGVAAALAQHGMQRLMAAEPSKENALVVAPKKEAEKSKSLAELMDFKTYAKGNPLQQKRQVDSFVTSVLGMAGVIDSDILHYSLQYSASLLMTFLPISRAGEKAAEGLINSFARRLENKVQVSKAHKDATQSSWQMEKMLMVTFVKEVLTAKEADESIAKMPSSHTKTASLAIIDELSEIVSNLEGSSAYTPAVANMMKECKILLERLNFIHSPTPEHKDIDWQEIIPKKPESSRKGLELHGLTRQQGLEKLKVWFPKAPVASLMAEMKAQGKSSPEAGRSITSTFMTSHEGGTGKTTFVELLALVLDYNLVKFSDISLSGQLLRGVPHVDFSKNLNMPLQQLVGLLPFVAKSPSPTIVLFDNIDTDSLISSSGTSHAPQTAMPPPPPPAGWNPRAAPPPAAGRAPANAMPPGPGMPPGVAAGMPPGVPPAAPTAPGRNSNGQARRVPAPLDLPPSQSFEHQQPPPRSMNIRNAQLLQSVFDPHRGYVSDALAKEFPKGNTIVFMTSNISFDDLPTYLQKNPAVKALRGRIREVKCDLTTLEEKYQFISRAVDLDKSVLHPSLQKQAQAFLRDYILECDVEVEEDEIFPVTGTRKAMQAFEELIRCFEELQEKHSASCDDILDVADKMRDILGTPDSIMPPIPEVDPHAFDIDLMDFSRPATPIKEAPPLLIDLSESSLADETPVQLEGFAGMSFFGSPEAQDTRR